MQEPGQHRDLKLLFALGLSLLHFGFHFQEEFFHLRGPRLLQNLFNEREIPKVMDIAQCWSKAVALITDQRIMHARSPKLWGDTNRIHACSASAGVRGVVGQLIRRADMDPPPLGSHTHARFILMYHRRLDKGRFQCHFDPSQVLIAGGDKAGDTACGELHSQQIVEQLAGTSIRHHLSLNQGHSERLDADSILGWGFDRFRKRCAGQMGAVGALFFFHLMLGDPEALARQIDHLAAFGNGGRTGVQIVLAVLTSFNSMHLHRI